MAEYIERDAVLSDLEAAEKHGGMGMIIANTLKRYVKRVPSADVAPVVHAKWINLPRYKSVGGTFQKAQICSACNAFYVSDVNTPFSNHRYCADCGAKMDAESEGRE